ncbi:hypothetical protein AGMMS49574_04160 [Bacteroidia bacterium]|nr:hypothetical protein AGMMS49574_04160 [Bacteroidia bacterium]
MVEYIFDELAEDDMPFQTPMYKCMLDEAVSHCREENFVASRYFLYHPDPQISSLAANLISEKYILSKYHTKYKEIKSEEELLIQIVPHDIIGFKDAYIRNRITEIGIRIKEVQLSGKSDQVIELMKEQADLNGIKKELNKRIGERIVLKM